MEEEEAAPSTSTIPNRRSDASSAPSSPEFSFWPAAASNAEPNPSLSSADELFLHGIILPSLSHLPDPKPEPDTELSTLPESSVPEPVPETVPEPTAPNPAAITAAPASASSSSKRWKDIFKLGEKNPRADDGNKDRRKDRKSGGPAGTEININIWPFGRSRSAGNGGSGSSRRHVATPARKVSSAPCSRSNSRGESSKTGGGSGSTGRRWAASPGRAGVHVGRSSPVWQIKRTGGNNKPAEPVGVGKGGKVITGSTRVINLSVNSCIGYGMRQGSCRGESKDAFTGGDRTESGLNGGRLFGIRGLFSKKVH